MYILSLIELVGRAGFELAFSPFRRERDRPDYATARWSNQQDSNLQGLYDAGFQNQRASIYPPMTRLNLVRREGFEPPRLSAHGSKPCVSAFPPAADIYYHKTPRLRGFRYIKWRRTTELHS
jgi:hypothetical protein